MAAVNHPQIVYDYVEPASEPGLRADQCINYVSCHDNYTLWDKLKFSSPKATDEEMRKMVKLAGALILTSQGVPFLHSGIEFCRTKNGNGNSYKSPDSINQIDWRRKKEFTDVFRILQKIDSVEKKSSGISAYLLLKESVKTYIFVLNIKLGWFHIALMALRLEIHGKKLC